MPCSSELGTTRDWCGRILGWIAAGYYEYSDIHEWPHYALQSLASVHGPQPTFLTCRCVCAVLDMLVGFASLLWAFAFKGRCLPTPNTCCPELRRHMVHRSHFGSRMMGVISSMFVLRAQVWRRCREPRIRIKGKHETLRGKTCSPIKNVVF